MAEKLSITIALEGGKQIEQQLEGIGKAGQQAFQDISNAAEQVGGFKNLKPEEVTQKLKDLGVTGKEALDKITGAVQTATRMEALVGVVQTVEKGFAGLSAAAGVFVKSLGPVDVIAGIIGTGLVKAMNEAAEAISKTDAQAIKLGLSIEKFDQLRHGFERMGSSAGAIGEGIAHVNGEIEKLNVERVKKAFETLKEGATRGFGGIGTDELKLLIEQANKVGPAAEAARKAITDLGGIAPSISALERLKITMGDASTVIPQFIEAMRQLPDTAQRTQDAISVLGTKLGVEFVQALRTGAVAVDQFKAGLGGMTQDQANAANRIEQDWNRVGSSWERLKTTLGATLLVNVPTNLISTLESIDNLLNPAKWSEWGSAAVQAIVDILAKIGELEVKLAHLIADMATAFAKGFTTGGGAEPGTVGPIPGNAAGGLIGGRGTGTSDSNLAWVSRGEHIMPASVVRQPGVLALLEQLRHGMGHFALGGVVPGLPRFAEGGLVGHLGTVDLRTDHGSVRLMAGSSAVEQLSRLAVTRRMTSTGRKPGFIG